MTDLMEVLAEQAADSEVAWSLGTFGALAEFMRDADEPVVLARDDGAVSAVTPRGGLRIARHSDLRPIAWESPTTESWSHRVALCLAEAQCAMSGRTAFMKSAPTARRCARKTVPASCSISVSAPCMPIFTCAVAIRMSSRRCGSLPGNPYSVRRAAP
jgi:hypothetical protein